MLSASSWTANKLVRGCGATGNNGPTGPPGPPGSAGLSIGQILYFSLSGNRQANAVTGIPVGSALLVPPTTGTGTNSVYSQYSGYFNEVLAPTPIADTVIGTFTSGNILPSIINAGIWNFNVSVFCGTPASTVGTTGWSPVAGTVYATITITDGSNSIVLSTNNASFPLNDTDFTQFSVIIPNNIAISNKASAYISINFYAKTLVSPAANTVFQFWSNGDSISDVITTLPSQSGPTGVTGPAGATGATGPQGTPGAAGAPGSTISGTPTQVGFFAANSGLTGSSNLTFGLSGLNVSQVNVGVPNGAMGNLVNVASLIPLVVFGHVGTTLALGITDNVGLTFTVPNLLPLTNCYYVTLGPRIKCSIVIPNGPQSGTYTWENPTNTWAVIFNGIAPNTVPSPLNGNISSYITTFY